jgi:hypothetical protein
VLPIILVAALIAGIAVFALYIRRNPFDQVPHKEKPGDCNEDCGTCFDVCTAVKVLKAETSQCGDFGDDELDAFAGIPSEAYSEGQIQIFADILESLPQEEVALWLESLRRRNIEFPSALRDEALMLVGGE